MKNHCEVKSFCELEVAKSVFLSVLLRSDTITLIPTFHNTHINQQNYYFIY